MVLLLILIGSFGYFQKLGVRLLVADVGDGWRQARNANETVGGGRRVATTTAEVSKRGDNSVLRFGSEGLQFTIDAFENEVAFDDYEELSLFKVIRCLLFFTQTTPLLVEGSHTPATLNMLLGEHVEEAPCSAPAHGRKTRLAHRKVDH